MVIEIRWRNGDGWHSRIAESGGKDDSPQERLAHLALTVADDIKNYLKAKKKKGRKK